MPGQIFAVAKQLAVRTGSAWLAAGATHPVGTDMKAWCILHYDGMFSSLAGTAAAAVLCQA
jgi:hypothetical protein